MYTNGLIGTEITGRNTGNYLRDFRVQWKGEYYSGPSGSAGGHPQQKRG